MTTPEVNPQPINQEALNAILSNPAFQEAIQVAIANGVDAALEKKELDSKPDFVIAYDDLSEDDYKELVANSNPDNEAYENRVQNGSEGVDNHDNASNNLMAIIPNNEKSEAAKIRPYVAILKDLKEERSLTAKRHWTTKGGNVSKGTKEVSATDPTKIDLLTDELAARLTLYSVKGEEQDDSRQVLILDMQAHGNLSDEDAMTLIDKIAIYDDVITDAENRVDEILIKELAPALKALVEAGKKPIEFFKNGDGVQTEEFTAMDKKFKKILDEIDNPIIRQEVLRGINAELKDYNSIALKKAAELAANPANLLTPEEITKRNINAKAIKIEEYLKNQAGNLGSWNAVNKFVSERVRKSAELYAQKQLNNANLPNYSETEEGKALVIGIGMYTEALIKAENPKMKQKEIEKFVIEEMKKLVTVFNEFEKPSSPKAPVGHNTAPKSPKAAGRVRKGLRAIREWRNAGMNPTGK